MVVYTGSAVNTDNLWVGVVGGIDGQKGGEGVSLAIPDVKV